MTPSVALESARRTSCCPCALLRLRVFSLCLFLLFSHVCVCVCVCACSVVGRSAIRATFSRRLTGHSTISQ